MHAYDSKSDRIEPKIIDLGAQQQQPDEQAPEPVERRASLPVVQRSLGQILMERGVLKARDVKKALHVQQARGMRFGEAVLKLKLASEEEVQHALASQFGYAYARPRQYGLANDLAVAVNPFSVEAEAVRALRSQLLMYWFNERQRLLAIVSPEAKEGRSYLSANLAVAFAQLGRRTLLIDADLRSPHQHTLFNLPDKSGLSTILSGRTQKSSAHQIPCLPSLWVVTAGPIPPNPLELVSRPEFGQLLEKARQYFDVVIIDTPPGDIYSDAEVVAVRARGGLMVGCKDRTHFGTIQAMSTRLGRSGVQVVGCVLNAA
jgi:receptor protein-tyrosine kinase